MTQKMNEKYKLKFLLDFKNKNVNYFLSFRELTKLPDLINYIGKINFFFFSSIILPLFFELFRKDALSIYLTSLALFISFIISLSFYYVDQMLPISNFYFFCSDNKLINKNKKIINKSFVKAFDDEKLLSSYCFIEEITWKTWLGSLFLLFFPMILFLAAIIYNYV